MYQQTFELIPEWQACFNWRLRIHIYGYVNGVTQLRRNLVRVGFELSHQRSVRSAHHLEVRPPKPDRRKFGQVVSAPNIILAQRGSPF